MSSQYRTNPPVTISLNFGRNVKYSIFITSHNIFHNPWNYIHNYTKIASQQLIWCTSITII